VHCTLCKKWIVFQYSLQSSCPILCIYYLFMHCSAFLNLLFIQALLCIFWIYYLFRHCSAFPESTNYSGIALHFLIFYLFRHCSAFPESTNYSGIALHFLNLLFIKALLCILSIYVQFMQALLNICSSILYIGIDLHYILFILALCCMQSLLLPYLLRHWSAFSSNTTPLFFQALISILWIYCLFRN
jgi:hypothetical protein